MTLVEYIQAARGNAAALAKALNVHKTQISNWARPKDPKTMIPPARCVQIENATDGGVTRQELRPDWLEIWPELATPCSGPKPPEPPAPTWNGLERRKTRK